MALAPLLDDTAMAIAMIRDARESHVVWVDHYRDKPDWLTEADLELVGDLAHHENCITEYDHVLTVLTKVATEAEVTE
jgi:hypothetical protein